MMLKSECAHCGKTNDIFREGPAETPGYQGKLRWNSIHNTLTGESLRICHGCNLLEIEVMQQNPNMANFFGVKPADF